MLHWFIPTGQCLYFFTSLTGSSLLAWFVLLHFPHWCIITGHGLYCFTSCFVGSSLLCMVCIGSLLASLVHHQWTWFVLFDYMLHLFLLTWYGLYCFTWCITGSFLLAIVCICSHPSLFHFYWTWFVLFHFLRWFIIIKHDLYWSFQDSLVHHHWAWFVLFDYTLYWFCLTGHGLHCFTSCFTGLFLLDIVYICSLPSLVHLYWAWLVLFTSRFTGSFFYWAWSILFHFPHWFIITGQDLYFVTSLTDSSLLGIACVAQNHASLVLPYWIWFILFLFMLYWFLLTGQCLY
jgi:hypothetical protein